MWSYCCCGDTWNKKSSLIWFENRLLYTINEVRQQVFEPHTWRSKNCCRTHSINLPKRLKYNVAERNIWKHYFERDYDVLKQPSSPFKNSFSNLLINVRKTIVEHAHHRYKFNLNIIRFSATLHRKST